MTCPAQFFLTYKLQGPEDHARAWPWYVLDSERLHHDILQMLFNESPEFIEALLGFRGRCTRQPERGMFDLLVRSDDGRRSYVEIKTDQKWSEDQREKQMKRLQQQQNAEGVLVLLSQQAALWPRDSVAQMTNNRFRKLSYGQLVPALERLAAQATRPEIARFATAYSVALREQEARTHKDWGNPDA